MAIRAFSQAGALPYREIEFVTTHPKEETNEKWLSGNQKQQQILKKNKNISTYACIDYQMSECPVFLWMANNNNNKSKKNECKTNTEETECKKKYSTRSDLVTNGNRRQNKQLTLY